MLLPSVIYSPAVLAAAETGFVHAAAHITGGGLPGNLVRVLPEGCAAVVDRMTWNEPQIFGEIRRLGPVADDEMERVFNLGIGMVLVVASDSADAVLKALSLVGSEPDSKGTPRVGAGVIGLIEPGARGVRIVGSRKD
jgi:phosphoribosylformylglycinamidine cyclo-ligase